MKTPLRLTVNGRNEEILVDSRAVLAEVLRDELRLTGTHIGCGTGSCGACTVLVNGETVKSCCLLALDAAEQDVTTIEGISEGTKLHPIQEAFATHQGLQCGYCTPGMVLSALQLLRDNPSPSEQEIRHGIAGNLCRCTGYHFIVDSVQAAAEELKRGSE